jgi:Tfp pilus assembly PilM family ATPase
MSKTAVGIYISSKNVDIIELGGSKSSPVILGFTRQEIPPEFIKPVEADKENANDQQNRAAVALKEGLDKLKIRPQSVQSVLSSSDVMIRYFDMPAIPKSEYAQAVRFEAKKYVPFKLDEITSDFKVLSSSADKKSIDIFFISATKERLNAHIGRLTAAGVHAAGIDIIPFALLRMLVLHKKADARDTIAMVYADSDRESLSIHIIDSGMPFMSRELKVMTDDKDAMFEKIASELRVSIDYYRRQKARKDVSKIVICGETLAAGLDAYIADELKIITETLYDFTKVKNTGKTPSSAIIAIGTALEGLGKSSYSVNLSPFHAVMQKRQAFNIAAIEAIAVIAIIFLTYLFANLSLRGVVSELRQLEARASELPKTTSLMDVERLTDKKKDMIENLEFLQLIQSDRVSVAGKLSVIAKNISSQREPSQGVWIESLNFKEALLRSDSLKLPTDIAREILISGSFFSRDDSGEAEYINKLFYLLKEDKVFMHSLKEIELDSIERKNIEGQWIASFNISAYSQKIPDTARERGRR